MTKDEFGALRVNDRFTFEGETYTVRDVRRNDCVLRANVRKMEGKRTFTRDDARFMVPVRPEEDAMRGLAHWKQDREVG